MAGNLRVRLGIFGLIDLGNELMTACGRGDRSADTSKQGQQRLANVCRVN